MHKERLSELPGQNRDLLPLTLLPAIPFVNVVPFVVENSVLRSPSFRTRPITGCSDKSETRRVTWSAFQNSRSAYQIAIMKLRRMPDESPRQCIQ